MQLLKIKGLKRTITRRTNMQILGIRGPKCKNENKNKIELKIGKFD
jgi:hypothetical protein